VSINYVDRGQFVVIHWTYLLTEKQHRRWLLFYVLSNMHSRVSAVDSMLTMYCIYVASRALAGRRVGVFDRESRWIIWSDYSSRARVTGVIDMAQYLLANRLSPRMIDTKTDRRRSAASRSPTLTASHFDFDFPKSVVGLLVRSMSLAL